MYIYIYKYTCMYIYIYIYVCMYNCVYISMCIDTNICDTIEYLPCVAKSK